MKSNIKKRKFFFFMILTMSAYSSFGQTKTDSLSYKKGKDVEEKNDRNVMLNATSATEPRQVAIGVPTSYTPVNENGLPVVFFFYPNTTSNHWRSDSNLSHVGLLKVSEVALTVGDIGYGVNSFTELGGESFKGKMNYRVNHWGAQTFDTNLSGPVTKNLYFTLGTYQNFDPGSFSLGFTNYNDRTQMYRAGLTHIFNNGKGKVSFLYKYANLHNLTNASQYSPFIYKGDGSVKELENFDMGLDSYIPLDGKIEYMDVRTGKMNKASIYDLAYSRSNEFSIFADFDLGNQAHLALKAKYTDSQNNWTDEKPYNILQNTTAKYADTGENYTGDIQTRISQINNSIVKDAFFTTELSKDMDNHHMKLGLNQWHTYVDFARSTAQYYHEVTAKPRRLILDNGKSFSNLNMGTEFYQGHENKLALFFTDDWQITSKLKAYYGARLEYYTINIDRLPAERFDGFYLGATNPQTGELVTLENYKKKSLNMAYSANITYNMTSKFGFLGELTYLQYYRHLDAYSGSNMPPKVRVPYTLGKLGIFYNHSRLSIVSALTYGKRNNTFERFTVVDPNGEKEPEVVLAGSGEQTIGWTTDIMTNPFKNFNLHFLFTLQEPKYTDYKFSAFNKEYDYTNKILTSQSKVLIEIDPSYSITKSLNIWASFRYFSKQYANIGNSLYFAGRWETFVGAKYKMNQHVTFNANVVNILNQKGATGTIAGSELITDASQYQNVLMVGTYMRPLTFEISANIIF